MHSPRPTFGPPSYHSYRNQKARVLPGRYTIMIRQPPPAKEGGRRPAFRWVTLRDALRVTFLVAMRDFVLHRRCVAASRQLVCTVLAPRDHHDSLAATTRCSLRQVQQDGACLPVGLAVGRNSTRASMRGESPSSVCLTGLCFLLFQEIWPVDAICLRPVGHVHASRHVCRTPLLPAACLPPNKTPATPTEPLIPAAHAVPPSPPSTTTPASRPRSAPTTPHPPSLRNLAQTPQGRRDNGKMGIASSCAGLDAVTLDDIKVGVTPPRRGGQVRCAPWSPLQ